MVTPAPSVAVAVSSMCESGWSVNGIEKDRPSPEPVGCAWQVASSGQCTTVASQCSGSRPSSASVARAETRTGSPTA